MDSKSPLQSKTILASIIVAAAAFFPPAQVLVAANPSLALGAASVILAGLRFLTSKKLSIF